MVPKFLLRETGSVFLKNTTLENFQVFFTRHISQENKFRTINSFNYCKDHLMQPLVKIYNFIIDSNCLILQLFLYHPCGLQIENQSTNMTSDLTSDQIGALALIGVEINIRGHESFISAGAKSQGEVLLSLVRLTSNTFIYISFKVGCLWNILCKCNQTEKFFFLRNKIMSSNGKKS